MGTEGAWFSRPLDADVVRGATELEQTPHGVQPHRLPAWARAQCPDPRLAMVSAQPSGVRVVVVTAATVLELDVLPTRAVVAQAAARPDGVYDLLVDGALVARSSATSGNRILLDPGSGTQTFEPGQPSTIRFEGLQNRPKLVEVWLPHNEMTVLVALRADAPIDVAPPTGRPVWLHHGSSISHGSDAPSPTSTWPAVAAAIGGCDLVNLGLGGNAIVDPFTAQTLRATRADVISVKLGINVVNHDAMRLRAFVPAVHGFLDTVREGHPTTPLLVVSPIFCPIHEHTPGPCYPSLQDDGRLVFRSAGDPAEVARGALTLTVVRDALRSIVEQRDDPNLAYLDGLALFSEADHAELPMPDDLHPDGPAHRRIGERFARFAFAPGRPLSPST